MPIRCSSLVAFLAILSFAAACDGSRNNAPPEPCPPQPKDKSFLQKQQEGADVLSDFSARVAKAVQSSPDAELVNALAVQAEIWEKACKRLHADVENPDYFAQAQCVRHLYRAWCESYGVIDVLFADNPDHPFRTRLE